MTDTTTTDAKSLTIGQRAAAAFRGITLPQALVVIALIAGAVYSIDMLPEEKLEWVKGLIIVIVTLGTGGTLFLSPASSAPAQPTPKRIVINEDGTAGRTRRDGSFGALDLVLLAIVLVGALVIVPLFASGCATTGGVAGAVAMAKPVLDVSCRVARTACDLVTRGCDLVSPAPTSGDELWSFPPALPGAATSEDAAIESDVGEPLDPVVEVTQ